MLFLDREFDLWDAGTPSVTKPINLSLEAVINVQFITKTEVDAGRARIIVLAGT